MHVVKFDVAEFREFRPKINLSDAQLEFSFEEAEMILNNTKISVVCDLKERKRLLYLLTSHIAQLQERVENGDTLVGRISSASEGSVSVSTDFPPTNDGFRGFLQQTQDGIKFWVYTKKYRSFRYIRSPFPTMAVNRWSR